MKACREKLLKSGADPHALALNARAVCGILHGGYLCFFYWALCLSWLPEPICHFTIPGVCEGCGEPMAIYFPHQRWLPG